MIRVLVTGSRKWTDYAAIARVLDVLLVRFGAVTVEQGGATGADQLAKLWARQRRAQGFAAAWETWRADWPRCTGPKCTPGHRRQRRDGAWYCPTAGHQRNALMVESGPDLVVAFRKPNAAGKSPGTDNCIAAARAAGYEPAVYEPVPEEVAG